MTFEFHSFFLTRIFKAEYIINRDYPFLPLNLNIVRIENLILSLLLKKIKLEKDGEKEKEEKGWIKAFFNL